MSDSPTAEQASFWRESLGDLVPMLKAKWQWVAGVAGVAAILQILIALNVDVDALKNNPQLFKDNPALAFRLYFFLAAQFVIIYIPSIYVFTVLYLQRVATQNPPQMTLMNFFYWLGQCTKKYLLLIAPMMGAGIVAGIAIAIAAAMKFPKPGLIGGGIFMLVAFCCYIYTVLRLFLVSPIAIFRRAPVIKNTWEITKGKCWRIFWNLIVLVFFLLLVFLIPFVVVKIAAYSLGKASLGIMVLSSVLQGVWQGVNLMASSIYCCTVYKILLQEKRQNAPRQGLPEEIASV